MVAGAVVWVGADAAAAVGSGSDVTVAAGVVTSDRGSVTGGSVTGAGSGDSEADGVTLGSGDALGVRERGAPGVQVVGQVEDEVPALRVLLLLLGISPLDVVLRIEPCLSCRSFLSLVVVRVKVDVADAMFTAAPPTDGHAFLRAIRRPAPVSRARRPAPTPQGVTSAPVDASTF